MSSREQVEALHPRWHFLRLHSPLGAKFLPVPLFLPVVRLGVHYMFGFSDQTWPAALRDHFWWGSGSHIRVPGTELGLATLSSLTVLFVCWFGFGDTLGNAQGLGVALCSGFVVDRTLVECVQSKLYITVTPTPCSAFAPSLHSKTRGGVERPLRRGREGG